MERARILKSTAGQTLLPTLIDRLLDDYALAYVPDAIVRGTDMDEVWFRPATLG